MATLTHSCPAVKPRSFEPVTGSFVWATPFDGTRGRLVISTRTGAAVYTVTAIRHDAGPHFGGHVAGYRLENEGNQQVYHVAIEPWGMDCDCFDGLIRQQHAPTPDCRACKHVTALQAALPDRQAA